MNENGLAAPRGLTSTVRYTGSGHEQNIDQNDLHSDNEFFSESNSKMLGVGNSNMTNAALKHHVGYQHF